MWSSVPDRAGALPIRIAASGKPHASPVRLHPVFRSRPSDAQVNPLLDTLQTYPFEKLRVLFKDVTPKAGLRPISFGIGEPKHPTPAVIRDAVVASIATSSAMQSEEAAEAEGSAEA